MAHYPADAYRHGGWLPLMPQTNVAIRFASLIAAGVPERRRTREPPAHPRAARPAPVHHRRSRGYQVAKAVRAQPRFGRTLMVALTGYGQPDDQRAALASGFDVHLTKPVDPDKLESMLDSANKPTSRRH